MSAFLILLFFIRTNPPVQQSLKLRNERSNSNSTQKHLHKLTSLKEFRHREINFKSQARKYKNVKINAFEASDSQEKKKMRHLHYMEGSWF